MELLQNIQHVVFTNFFQHLAIITAVYFITWAYSLRGKFLIDDHEGIERFRDQWVVTKDPTGKVTSESKVDWYEENGKRWKNFQLNLSVGFYSGLLRFIRSNLGKRFVVIAQNSKGHDVFGYIQDPFRHHVISLVVQYANLILGYLFLRRFLGDDLAFRSILLFSVHPLCCQSIAWISGLGYAISLFFGLLTFNLSMHFNNDFGLIPIAITNFLSISALLSGIANPIILAFLHKWYAFASTLCVSVFLLSTWGKTIVSVRKQAFHEQHMEKSTKLNLRKPIVIIKTLFYYLKMIVFPKRIGLFHVWGYHYEDKIERTDKGFWMGLSVIIALLAVFPFAPFPVKFGMLWLFSYLILFSNIITAQQFVADRYAFISVIGYSIILSWLLTAYPVFFAFILGLYMMRTMIHLPTFLDDKHLYESNIFNFPNSEIAYANLGVVFNQEGRVNGAIDMWQESIKRDKFYSVPHYNLAALLKSSGQLEQACDELQKCLNSKIVQFQELWSKEMTELRMHLARKKEFDALNNRLDIAMTQNKFEEIPKIKQDMEELKKKPLVQDEKH